MEKTVMQATAQCHHMSCRPERSFRQLSSQAFALIFPARSSRKQPSRFSILLQAE